MFRNRWFRGTAIAVVLTGIGLSQMASSCEESAAPTSAQCAFIVGDGNDGRDRAIKQIVWPGQNIEYNEAKERVHYIACGPRNYKINDGSVRDGNGKQVGDRLTPVKVWTKATPDKPSIQLDIWLSVYWTPNQGALDPFYALCHKYHCYTEDAGKAADANYSEPGWNGMLGETFSDTINTGVAMAVVGTPDKPDSGFTSELVRRPAEWDLLAKAAAQDFLQRVRLTHGYNADLFCGSGNSGWKEPEKPGTGEYTCTTPRFEINLIQESDPELRKQRSDEAALAQRIANAKQLYGDQWPYWLGVQDAMEKCKELGLTTCVISQNGVTVSIPAAQPAAK